MKKGILILSIIVICLCACSKPNADLVLKNGQVYTQEESQPWASAIVIRGNKIVAVFGNDSETSKYVGPATQVIDLRGQFVMPGFIDAHVHFAGYAAQQHDIQLMNVDDDEALMKELQRVVTNVGPNEWITGGDWSGAIQWMEGRGELDGPEHEKRWEPHRKTVDSITQDNPCLLNSYDGELFLANTAALRAAGLENASLQGMQLDESGIPTGLLFKGSPAIVEIRIHIKPKSEERRLKEYRTGLRLMAEMGIHPKTKERDYFLRFGGFKSANDGFLGDRGAMLFEPYSDRPDYKGHYQEYNSDSDTPGSLIGNPEVYYRHCQDAVEHGFCVDSHAIGDRGFEPPKPVRSFFPS